MVVPPGTPGLRRSFCDGPAIRGLFQSNNRDFEKLLCSSPLTRGEVLVKGSLATELKSLVSWGLPRHCLTRPTLRSLVLKRRPDVEGRELSQLICKKVEIAAWRLSPQEAKACLVLLRLSNESTNNATINREAAIAHLGKPQSVETFRREPELALMQKLAEALQQPSEDVWAVDCEVISHSPLELRVRLRQA